MNNDFSNNYNYGYYSATKKSEISRRKRFNFSNNNFFQSLKSDNELKRDSILNGLEEEIYPNDQNNEFSIGSIDQKNYNFNGSNNLNDNENRNSLCYSAEDLDEFLGINQLKISKDKKQNLNQDNISMTSCKSLFL